MKINISNTIVSTNIWKHDNPRTHYFSLLDQLYFKGIRKIECAANYPVCGIPEYFRYTEDILHDWIVANGIIDMEIYARVGEISNAGGDNEINYSGSFYRMLADDYLYKFRKNLKSLVIASDCNQEKEILEGLDILKDYKHVHLGFYAINNCNRLMEYLKANDVVPDVFINPDIKLETNVISSFLAGNIFIDFKNMSNPVLQDSMTFFSSIIEHFIEYENNNPLPGNCGLMLPARDSAIADAILSFKNIEHAA